MSRVAERLESICRAREYTSHLLTDLSASDWFRMPDGNVSHVGWQVGHLAFAQYRLALERVRGPRAEDAELLPPPFLERFGRGSTPVGNPNAYPALDDVRRVFDTVHQQVLREISALDDAVLDEPTDPHSRFATKGGALTWCAEHEMMHAGQIGLLRRLLGKTPLW